MQALNGADLADKAAVNSRLGDHDPAIAGATSHLLAIGHHP